MKIKAIDKLLGLLMVLALLLGLAACGKKDAAQDSGKTASPSDSATAEPTAEPTAAQPETGFVPVEYTTAFSIEYLDKANDIKLVTDAEGNKFLLVPKTAEVPSGYEDAALVRTPLENVVFASATQVCMLRPFKDLWGSVSGVSSGAGEWGDGFPEIEAGLADGSIYNISTSGGVGGFDFEAIAEDDPDMVFLYTGDYGQTDLLNKCEDLGIPYAVDNEYMEGDYLGRREWLKFIAAFYNRDEDAAEYFESQLALDKEMKEAVAGAGEKPKVAWAMVWSGTVYIPGNESYVAKQIKAAGGDYLFKDIAGTGSVALTLEEFYDKLEEADVLIYSNTTTYCSGLSAILEDMPLAADTAVFKNGNVWLFSSNYYLGTDESVTQTVDAAAIFHPKLFEDHTIKYFVKAQ